MFLVLTCTIVRKLKERLLKALLEMKCICYFNATVQVSL